jgi:F-type H+-transporting ATPase subunit a
MRSCCKKRTAKAALSAIGLLFLVLFVAGTLSPPLSVLAQDEDGHGEAVSEQAHGQEEAHGEAETHEGGHGEGGISTHLPTLITLFERLFGPAGWVEFLHAWENVFFSLLVIIFMTIVAYTAYRKREKIPGPLQNLVEILVETFASFVEGILGREDGRRFVPFLGTLFFYILLMNFFGLIPLMKSPTSVFNTTIALAISVFIYVQYTGIRRLGIGGYLFHLAGEPRGVIGWSLVVIMLPLHIVGEFARPVSLGLRLFGNIMGEDTLLAVFLGLGVLVLRFIPVPVGIPLHLPFIFLAILTSTIQALVFTLLSTIYISQVLPHHDEEEHGGEHETAASAA